MYKDIINTVDALNSIKESTANNKISREQIENLSAGLQNDNIDTSESLEKRFNPNQYSNTPSSISVSDAVYIADRVEFDVMELADNNRREALNAAVASMASLISKIKHISELNNPDLDKLNIVKEYYNRPKYKFDVYEGSLKEDIECEYIPLEIFNNRDQLETFKTLSVDCSQAGYILETIFNNSPMHFYPFLNWVHKALKDVELSSRDDYNWRLLFENNSIAPVNVSEIAEAIIDGRLLLTLTNLKNHLEKELSYAVLSKVESLKTVQLTTTEVTNEVALNSLKYAGVFDKMYKDKVSLLFVEFLYTTIYTIKK